MAKKIVGYNMPHQHKDIAGETVGSLTAEARLHRNKFGAWVWRWCCTCGKAREAVPSELRTQLRLGRTISCGRCHVHTGKQAAALTGRTDFGDWTVLRRATNVGVRPIIWECQCGCGEIHLVRGKHLTGGQSTRCLSCAAKGRADSTGEKLRRLRLKKRWTIAQAAAKVGITKQAWHQMEHGQRSRERTLQVIHEIFGVTFCRSSTS